MRTNVYVDGFNLYYGCLKDTPCKWLDLARFCRLALPQNAINRIQTNFMKARLNTFIGVIKILGKVLNR
ncbi:MAG: hypothetical protein ACT4P5_06000 [Armatimonadota bacterium]